MGHAEDDVIAVVGAGCKVPGADNIREYWRLLLKGENHIVEIPASRWNADACYDSDPMALGKSYVRRAGLVSRPDEFDNKLYGINDFESAQMDPQQRFALDCTYMALEDAGLTRAQLAGSNTGVFIGVMNADYRGLFTAQCSNTSNYTVTGISNSVIAARISYVFDLRGPCLVLDTACSSSLVAVHLGCQAIRTGDCDLAICGGVNYLGMPDVFVHLSKARMLSPTGQCHAFSSQADGYTRGEGCGVVILKRLRQAERDGDNIWATIYTGVNQDGHAVAPITAPSGIQQTRLLHNLYSSLDLDASRIDYIEAHGTGTIAGDPVEVNSLGEYFTQHGAARPRYIGSVKTNIGHLESAAGVVGIIKVLLMMKNQKIVPSLHCDVPNPKIRFEEFQLRVPREVVDWSNPDKMACCNSFGFGGSNSHALLHFYNQPVASTESSRVKKPCVVCFSAVSPASLRAMMEEVFVDATVPRLSLHDVSYTSTVRRDHYPVRCACVVEDINDLLGAVQDELTRETEYIPVLQKPRVVYVFCGMGTAWPGMCSSLIHQLPVFRDAIFKVERCLQTWVTWSLTERLQEESSFIDPEFTPIAIFACQVALAAVWRELGVEPECVVGQSVGEVAAAHVAGCLSLEEAVKVVQHRTRLLAAVAGGKMTVVRNVGVDKVRGLLAKYSGKAVISLQYSSLSCCISADADVMPEVKAELAEQLRARNKGLQLLDLNVPVAYHSHHVDSCRQPLEAALDGLSAKPPRIPFSSCVTGQRLTAEPGVQYWVDNLRKPVLFDLAVQQSKDSAHKTVFLEIGPKPTLKAHLPDIFPKEQVPSVTSMQSQPEYKTFLKAVAELYSIGVDVTWKNLPTLGGQVTNIPRYVFDKRKSLAKTEAAIMAQGGVDEGRRMHPYTHPVHSNNSYKLVITPLATMSIYDHVISGKIVVPGAFYAEAGFAISNQLSQRGSEHTAVSVEFHQAMGLSRDDVVEIDVLETDRTHGQRSFKIVKDNRLLASLQLLEGSGEKFSPDEMVNVEHVRSRCFEFIPKDAIYAALRKSGFQYGENFCLLEHAYTNSSECLALIKVNKKIQEELAGTTIHPCILDCSLQSSLVITASSNAGHELLPTSLGHLRVRRPMEPTMLVHTTLKFQGDWKNYYRLRLVSLEGHVIADMDDLVINLITDSHQRSLPDMFAMVWTPKVPLPPHDVIADDQTLVLLSDQVTNWSPHPRQVHISCAGLAFGSGLPESLQQVLRSNKDAAAYCLLFFKSFSDESDAAELDADIVNASFLLKGVLELANSAVMSAPIYVCTCGAWPADDSAGHPGVPTNPPSTALWGLVRSVVRERIYPRLVAVDFHLPPSRLTPSFLQRALGVLLSSAELRNYPEMRIDESWISVNHLVIADPNTPIPQYRDTSADRSRTAVLLSRDATSVVSPIAVQRALDDGPCDNDHVFMNSQVFALHRPNFLRLKMRYEQLLKGKPTRVGGYTVFSVEVLGQALPTAGNKTGEALVACYPMTVATRLSVPASTTLPASLLPGYQPGYLSKLVILFQLSAQVETPGVTVLCSRRTKGLAGVIEDLLTRKSGENCFSVSVVTSDQIISTKVLHDTIVSLTLLDGAVMADVASRWHSARCLVTCSGLIDSEAMACASCLLPDIDIRLLDTQTLFQASSLKRVVPEAGKAIRKLGPHIGKITAALNLESSSSEESQDNAGVPDLAELLTFQRWEMGQLQVKVGHDELFRKDACYLVVGGLTGLGWLCVQYLAKTGAGYIAILNRRQASPDSQSDMAKLGAQWQCHIRAFQGDVTSLQSLSNLLQQIQTAFPNIPLKGIFFGAAVTEDKSFLSMDVTSFDKALAPKVRGVWNLHVLTRYLDLDYFVMHSSVTAVVGNGGQTNYAAGNAFMDGMAHFRRSQGLAGQSMNWGALDLGLLDNNSLARQVLESQGFVFMSKDEILSILTPMLLLNWPQSCPMKLDVGKLSQRMNRDGLLPLRSRLEKILKSSVQEAEIGDNLLQEVQRAKLLAAEDRRAVYGSYVRFLAAKVLSVDVKAIGPATSLIDLGMDSIVAMTMMNQIHRDTSCRLPVVVFVTGEPNVTSIADALTEASDSDGVDQTTKSVPTHSRKSITSSNNNKNSNDSIPTNSNNSSSSGAGAKAQTAGARSGPVIVELKDGEKWDNCGPWEASQQELQTLLLYQRPSCKTDAFHGTVDVLLTAEAADVGRVQQAIAATCRQYPASRVRFSLDTAATKCRLTPLADHETGVDLKVVQSEHSSPKELCMLTHKVFDLQRETPLRFILLTSDKPELRVVYNKVAFDFHSALAFGRDLQKFLTVPAKTTTAGRINSLPWIPDSISSEQAALLSTKKSSFIQFWTPLLDRTIARTSLASSPVVRAEKKLSAAHRAVTVQLSRSLVQAVRQHLNKHRLFLLGLIASGYQLVLHALTKNRTISVVFPLDLHLVFHKEANGQASSRSNDVPLVTDFSSSKEASATLQSFVTNNCSFIIQCLSSGVLPFTMLETLNARALTLLQACAHGIAIERTEGAGFDFDAAVSLNDTGRPAQNRNGWHIEQTIITDDDLIVMPGDLETNLFILHDLPQDVVRLSLAYDADVITRRGAEVILRGLIYVMSHVTTQADVKLKTFVRQVRRYCKMEERKERKYGALFSS